MNQSDTRRLIRRAIRGAICHLAEGRPEYAKRSLMFTLATLGDEDADHEDYADAVSAGHVTTADALARQERDDLAELESGVVLQSEAGGLLDSGNDLRERETEVAHG